MGLKDNDDLEDWMISHLLNEMHVSSYLDIMQCKRTNSEYVPSNNGWKKGMSFTMTLNISYMPNCITVSARHPVSICLWLMSSSSCSHLQ